MTPRYFLVSLVIPIDRLPLKFSQFSMNCVFDALTKGISVSLPCFPNFSENTYDVKEYRKKHNFVIRLSRPIRNASIRGLAFVMSPRPDCVLNSTLVSNRGTIPELKRIHVEWLIRMNADELMLPEVLMDLSKSIGASRTVFASKVSPCEANRIQKRWKSHFDIEGWS